MNRIHLTRHFTEFENLEASVLLSALVWLFLSIKRPEFECFGNLPVLVLLVIFLVLAFVHEIFYQYIFWLVLGICTGLFLGERSQGMPSGSFVLR